MDLLKLNSRNPDIARAYIVKKFKSFKGPTYSKKRRREKCQDYYVAAAAGPHGQGIIETVYPQIFANEMFDIDAGAARARKALAMKPERVMVESGSFIDGKADFKQALINLRGELQRDLDGGEWQLGPSYFERLKVRMAIVDAGICDQTQFVTEFQDECQANIRSNVAMSKREAEAAFDLMVGYSQTAAVRFDARSANWGQINAKLEEAFKAGLWASGNAKAKWNELGFSAEAEAAIAVGALLEIQGELAWSKGSAGIKLGGKAEAFAGARMGGSAKLSVNARKGFEAAFAAGAFAGVEFKAEGSCVFEWNGEMLASATGSASVTFGAGAEFSAAIKASLFGPTTFEIEGNVTLGIGTAASVNVSVNFDQMALASSAAFRQAVYWRTIARGYETTLMDSDAKNLHYLKKCIVRLDAEIEDTGNLIDSYHSTPMESRSLLMSS